MSKGENCQVIKDDDGYISLCVEGSIVKICIGRATDGYFRFNALAENISFSADALREIARLTA